MDTSTPVSETPIERRTVLLGAGAVGAAGVLAACGGSGSTQAETPTSSMAATEVPGQATLITKTGDVPVGGGIVVENKMVVVTQPTAGEYKAFTSTCTHQGCTVNEVTAEEIVCPCHGSKFSTTTGEVLQGPAVVGLAPVSIDVQGDDIMSQA
jgi:Rieske Fe-S protein